MLLRRYGFASGVCGVRAKIIMHGYLPIFLMLIFSLPAYSSETYVPTMESTISGTLLPCAVGYIKEVSKDKLLLVTETNETLSVSINKSTKMFTVYGGMVFKHDLKPLLNIKIWYKGKSCKGAVQPLVAHTVMFSATEPGYSWP